MSKGHKTRSTKGKIRVGVSTVLLILFSMSWALFFSNFKDSLDDKLLIMRNDLTDYYYDQQKLITLLEEKLGEAYTGNLREDFDNFVLTTVLEEFQTLEDDKWKRYNTFFSKERMEEYEKSGVEGANRIAGNPLNEKTYYLELSDFYFDLTYKRVEECIPEMKMYSNLILDLRNNTGGHLSELEKVADLFLDSGQVIYELQRSSKLEASRAKQTKKLVFEKIVILTNHQTASSSELMILALKENLENVIIIGTPTYGKYISFGQRKFKDGSGMIFINSLMTGPNGSSIGKGVQPDVLVGHDGAFYEGLNDEEKDVFLAQDADLQIETAMKYLQELDF